MRKLWALLALLLLVPLGARTFSYAWVHSLPKGVEKDYYIWRYLRQKSTSKAQARNIIREASSLNPSLKKAYRRKTGLKPPTLSRRKPRKLSPTQKRELARKRAIVRQVLASSDPGAAWRRLAPEMQLFVFKEAGTQGRKKLDYTIDEAQWQRLSRYPDANLMIHYVRRDRLPGLSRILRFKPAKNNALRYEYLMRMGFEALGRGQTDLAEYDFARAVSKASKRELADRALFWAWKAEDDRDYLKKLVKSYDINLYTLAGRDALKLPYNLGITPDLPSGKVPGFDIRNPIQWHRLKTKIFNPHTDMKALARKFHHAETVGHWTYIKTKADKDVPQYFPMPYREYLAKFPVKRQAILYAIARQESRFIPASVSGSFALGMMQIMPFLVDHLRKVRHERIDYDDLFDPITALKYANTHLDYLTKWLHHPLFVAYAYNAGIGYTRRLIRRKDLFENNQKYDPWISLERVANYQANDYGKKVLANYVVYMNKLGYPLRITDLLSVVHLPKFTDEFRKIKK
ncbi:transglycosylase SLT domain-containing protein [Nitratifractor sp.]|uniref:transglycosylase SLT domain-containing protein n=1 Tax=Nitratifractor sp. TaxID=2268144 RepID=UPI0025E5317D|nr:transglycosylase SLT domain-containing protein [Nitratifractor sp.]